MTSKRMTRAEVIRWLGDAISTETEKSFEEIDYDFVEECGCLLDELMGKSAAMSEEEIAVRMEKLKPDTSAVRKKVGRRRLWKIVVAVAVVLCMCMTVVAIPELRVRLLNALQLDVGESVVEDGVTYTHSGKTMQYDDIDSLITSENLDILSFEDSTNTIKITNIRYIDEASMTTISFNDPTIYFEILHDQNYIIDVIKESQKKHLICGADVYLLSKEMDGVISYSAYIFYKDDTYIIRTTSEETLEIILDSLKNGDS